MIACGAAQRLLDFAKCCVELVLVSADEFAMLDTVEEEVELGDRSNLVGHRSFTALTRLDSTEDDGFVSVGTSICFKSWLESHAWRTSWRPEVNDYSLVIFDDTL